MRKRRSVRAVTALALAASSLLGAQLATGGGASAQTATATAGATTTETRSATATPATATPATPAVLPALRQWQAGTGGFTLRASSRILVDPRYAGGLATDARTFAADLAAEGVPALPVAVADPAGARPGDLVLTEDPAALPVQGYRLDVTADRATLTGGDPAGVFYAEQSTEQLLGTAQGHDRLPAGTGQDAPSSPAVGDGERGLMLDTAREYWPVGAIEQTIRQMAWLKLDTFHWHLTDSEAFRLRLPGYPGLAAARSYSPADVRAVLDYARRYHVRVVPELDIPGHATSLTAYRPALRWDCPSMNQVIHAGRIDPGFTVDITKPASVTWLDGLVDAALQVFDAADAPVVHLGGDETPDARLQSQCPELTQYAAAQGYRSPEDVFLAYENHLDRLVRSHGRTMEMWGWWPQVGGGSSVSVDKDVLIQAWLGDEAGFESQGYRVVVSNEHSRLYVVPKALPGTGNGNYIPDDSALYSSYAPAASPQLAGVEMAEWGDIAFEQPWSYFAQYLRRPMAALASATWRGPQPSASLTDYEALADHVGGPPGVGAPLSPVEPGTAAVDASGYAGPAVAVRAVRITPRSSATADLAGLVGGSVEGCAQGPDSGCRVLARVTTTPALDALTLTAADTSQAYGWFRWVPGTATATPARIEVLTPGPAEATGVRVTVASGEVTIGNGGDRAILPQQLRVAGAPVGGLRAGALPPGGAETVRVDTEALSGVLSGVLAADLTYRQVGSTIDRFTVRGTATLPVRYRSLAQAYDDIGSTEDANPEPGNLDGAQDSLSRQALPAPGGTVTAGPFAYTWPGTPAGDPDNVLAQGQTIPLGGGPASAIGLLATATYAPTGGLSASGTVTYTDGSTSGYTLTVPDWSAGTGPVAVATGVVNANGRAQAARTADLYSLTIPVDAGKQPASLTLPALPGYLASKTPQLHVFALATAR